MLESSALALVEHIFQKALQHKASDIHLESTPHGLRVRYRCNGFLSEHMSVLHSHAAQVIARIKLIAHLDVSEKRIPQDGVWRYQLPEQPLDIRIATFPSVYGEKLVARLLYHHEAQYALDYLGLPAAQQTVLKKLLQRPQGFFLVTGPTGSGKTTTLYALLSLLRSADRNIVTLEDPLEYHIDGITQTPIRADLGFTFAQGIRAVLRQDPDVLMIGEIRDEETAAAAFQAALTGHVMLSTLHTTDAVSAIIRLRDMKIPLYLIAATVTAVLAQRLLRILCAACKVAEQPTADEQEFLQRTGLSLTTVYHPRGCVECSGTGYSGRQGIFEFFVISPEIRELLHHQDVSYTTLYEAARRDGLVTLFEHALAYLKDGTTTVHEIMRVV